ncbi:helix-turn-helix domain-containing protein [Chryseobacterium sp. Chry.R1]|uniref:helix-turn-helix domain-containing protein n=1 Tax=Chryseobacterium sp. Chry.R1 TaxID=3139392 RepID=UPI0031F78AAC
MKEEHELNIVSFVGRYFNYILPEKEMDIVCLSVSGREIIPLEGNRIHFYMIIIGVKGKTRIKAGSHQFLIMPNSVSVIPAESWVALEKPQKTFDAKFIFFEPSFLKKGWAYNHVLNDLMFINPNYPPTFPLKGKQQKDFLYKLNKISQEIDTEAPFGMEMIRLYLVQILFEYNRICEICLLNSDTSINRKFQIMHRFRQLVDLQFKDNKTVASYADQMNITPKYLSECVAEHLGYPALKVIQNRILREAEVLLKYTEKSIKEISNELQFDSPTHFSRFIQHQKGKTPTELRQQP